MRSAVGQILVATLLAACSTRQPVLPPPAPAAGAAVMPPSAPPEPSIEATRRAEEAIERVDVSALLSSPPPVVSRELPITPMATARLRARVVDPFGHPVSGALVILHSMSDGEEHRARSDGEGAVTFAGLAPGDYLLGGDPADGPELTAIPLRLAAGDAPDTIEIRLLGSPSENGEARGELSRILVSA